MALDLNDPELEFSDLVYAYQSWVMAVINDEKLEGEEQLLTDDIAEDALNSMRFLPGEVTSAIETSLARVYDVDADELADMMNEVAQSMGVTTVSSADIKTIMSVLDQDNNGEIDKKEFLDYLMLTFECVLGEEDQ